MKRVVPAREGQRNWDGLVYHFDGFVLELCLRGKDCRRTGEVEGEELESGENTVAVTAMRNSGAICG